MEISSIGRDALAMKSIADETGTRWRDFRIKSFRLIATHVVMHVNTQSYSPLYDDDYPCLQLAQARPPNC